MAAEVSLVSWLWEWRVLVCGWGGCCLLGGECLVCVSNSCICVGSSILFRIYHPVQDYGEHQ